MATQLERATVTTSRLLDFVGRRELTAQIGHPPPMWPLVVLKEALDNALDACEEAEIAPEIVVEVSTETDEAMISVADNGPGLSPETVSNILDFSTRTSSREAYVSPTRGAQGNALKTILAMPYALGDECAETQIESRGTWHRITFTADAVRQVPQVTHKTERNDDVKNGTSLTVFWPDLACSYLRDQKGAFLQMCAGYAVLNPHLKLTVRWGRRLC
jgi:DNA topoisomerase VI subunit B